MEPKVKPYRGGWVYPHQYKALVSLNRKGGVEPATLLDDEDLAATVAEILGFGWCSYHEGLIRVTPHGRHVLGLNRITEAVQEADHRYADFKKHVNYTSMAAQLNRFTEMAWEDHLIDEDQRTYLRDVVRWMQQESTRWLRAYEGKRLRPVKKVATKGPTDKQIVKSAIHELANRSSRARTKIEIELSRDSFTRNSKGWLISPGDELDVWSRRGIVVPNQLWWWDKDSTNKYRTEIASIFDQPGGPLNEAGVGPGRTRSYLSDLEVAEKILRKDPVFKDFCDRLWVYAVPLLDYLDNEVDVPSWLEAAWSVIPYLDSLDLPEVTDIGVPIWWGGTGHRGRPRQVLHERVIPALKQVETLDDDPLEATTVLAKALHRIRYCFREHWEHGRIHPREPDYSDILELNDDDV